MTGGRRGQEAVGRQQELAELDQVLADVRAGHPRFAVVAGPAGIGRTTLAELFLDRHPELRVDRVTALPWEQQIPFGLLDRLVGPGGPGRTTAPAAATRLLADWTDGDPEPTIAVVVDDAQWADVDSLRALLSAHHRLSAERVLVLLLARDDPASEISRFLDRCPGPVVRVRPLGPSEVRTLAMLHAGQDLSAPTAYRLAEHTAGNPRHVRDLLRELPAESWSRWQAALPAPRALAAEVERALAGCGPGARALVECAAVLGRTVALADAAELAGLDDPVSALDEAGRAGLIDTVPGRGPVTLTFRDPLAHAAVYHGLSPLHRYERHREAARLAQDTGTALLHRVAVTPFHDAALAAELEEYAGVQAALGVWSAVGAALVSAGRLSPDRGERQRRLLRAVDALVGTGDLAQAGSFAAEIESFPPSPLRDEVLGYLAILRGRPAEAELLLSQAWERCHPEREPETAALICQRRVLHSLSRWHGPDLVAWGRRAVELADPHDPSAVETQVIMGLGLAATGQSERARRTYDEVVSRISLGAQSQRAQMGKGWLDLAMDDPQAARRELATAVPTEYRRGSVRISLWAQAWLARTEFALGSWDEAVQTVNRAAVQLDNTGLELVRPLVHWTGAQVHALRGDLPRAEEHLKHASASAHNYEVMFLPSCLAAAQCAEAQSDYDGVLRALEPLVQLRSREGIDEPGFWPWHDVYGNALVMTNRVEEADAFLTPHERLAAERGHRSTLARLGYVRGRIHGALGDVDAARESFEGALERIKSLPLPYERTRIRFAYGQTLRRAGKRKEAEVVLRRARDGYAAFGATTYVERCDRELKAGGLHPKRGVDLAELTPQEQAVAGLVAEGRSNKQVAVELFVSVKTVQFHLTRIYAKLGVRSRSELAAQFRAATTAP
ncbi:LuxR C-terminal-related transcriptional regulator [Saccharopolyspora cebuensis]|uniref:LuxR C-terminal-related transcriptional regulator n=1 Tax=Saccharopolyspora cebuensis TaxID=418759 RepID=A0ABV4CBE4_9PSEU